MSRIAIGNDILWIIDSDGFICKYDGTELTKFEEKAVDIGVGNEETVMIIEYSETMNDYKGHTIKRLMD